MKSKEIWRSAREGWVEVGWAGRGTGTCQAEKGMRKSRRVPCPRPRGNYLMGAQPEHQRGHNSSSPLRKVRRVSSQTSATEEL